MNKWKRYFVKWPLFWWSALLFVAIFAPFLANQKPILTVTKGHLNFPALTAATENPNPSETTFSIHAPIPFSASSMDGTGRISLPPFSREKSTGKMHWLGTDNAGRDIVAALIYGCKRALFIALGASLLALLIGIILGSLAGYVPVIKIHFLTLLWTLAGFIIIGSFINEWIALMATNTFVNFVKGFFFIALLISIIFGIAIMFDKRLRKVFPRFSIYFPLDDIVIGFTDAVRVIPLLFLLLGLITLFPEEGYLIVALVVGLGSWPGIALQARSAIAKAKNLPATEAARALGIKRWRLFFKHLFPAALPAVLIAGALAFANALLADAYLSFLGIGNVANASWGSLIADANTQQNLLIALWPGIILTLSLLSLQQLIRRFQTKSFS